MPDKINQVCGELFFFMQQISISEAAQAHFRRLLEQQEEGTNIRILRHIRHLGCPG